MNSSRINEILHSAQGRQVVVASKYIDATQIQALSTLGLHDFGENRVDALLQKYEILKEDDNIRFHFIGHLQSNKAKLVANKIVCLHSLDSLKVARLLQEELRHPLDCYVELHLTDNEAKSGVKESDLASFLDGLQAYPKINVIGFMAMSDRGMDDNQKRAVFAHAKALADLYGLPKLSMGMSDDYLLAIEEGATTLRLGRIITNNC